MADFQLLQIKGIQNRSSVFKLCDSALSQADT